MRRPPNDWDKLKSPSMLSSLTADTKACTKVGVLSVCLIQSAGQDTLLSGSLKLAGKAGQGPLDPPIGSFPPLFPTTRLSGTTPMPRAQLGIGGRCESPF